MDGSTRLVRDRFPLKLLGGARVRRRFLCMGVTTHATPDQTPRRAIPTPTLFPLDRISRQMVRRMASHAPPAFGSCRSFHQRVPWQFRHQAPGGGC